MDCLMKKDGAVTIWQWQENVGKERAYWQAMNLPRTGDGYTKPLHDQLWEQTASGQCWQRWGVHGFLNEESAMACLPLVRSHGRQRSIRLVQIEMTRSTTVVVDLPCTAGVLPAAADDS